MLELRQKTESHKHRFNLRPNLLSDLQSFTWNKRLDHFLFLTLKFHWTSAGCSSSQFQAVWQNPPGTGAASCYHRGSGGGREAESLSWLRMGEWIYQLRAQKGNMIKHFSKKWLEDLFSIWTRVKPLWLIFAEAGKPETTERGLLSNTRCSPLIVLCHCR